MLSKHFSGNLHVSKFHHIRKETKCIQKYEVRNVEMTKSWYYEDKPHQKADKEAELASS